MTLPSVEERPNRKQLEQSESWIFLVFCVVVVFFFSFPSERRRGTYSRLPAFVYSFFAPLTVLESGPPPLAGGYNRHRNLGIARKWGTFVRGNQEPSKSTRDLKKKRAERRKRGMGGACRVRVVPLTAPPSNYRGSCKEKNARQPSCMYAKWKLQKVSQMALSVSNLVEGGAEREMEIKTAQLPKRPARRKINRRPLVLVEVPLDVLLRVSV